MSYGTAAALQAAVYQHLINDAALTAKVGSDIYDAFPSGTVPSLYVTLGPETATDRSDKTSYGAEHEFTVSVISDSAGFQASKSVAACISDALRDIDLTLDRGSLIYLNFQRARAKREGTGDIRRIDLSFVARIEDI